MAADVLTNIITVKNGDDSYDFRIPTPMEFGRIALRARTLRVQAEGPGAASEQGLDQLVIDMFRGMALFELLLQRADVTWPWSEAGGRLAVESSKFPADKVMLLADIYVGFDVQFATFLRGGSGDRKPAGAKDVAGEPDPSVVAV